MRYSAAILASAVIFGCASNQPKQASMYPVYRGVAADKPLIDADVSVEAIKDVYVLNISHTACKDIGPVNDFTPLGEGGGQSSPSVTKMHAYQCVTSVKIAAKLALTSEVPVPMSGFYRYESKIDSALDLQNPTSAAQAQAQVNRIENENIKVISVMISDIQQQCYGPIFHMIVAKDVLQMDAGNVGRRGQCTMLKSYQAGRDSVVHYYNVSTGAVSDIAGDVKDGATSAARATMDGATSAARATGDGINASAAWVADTAGATRDAAIDSKDVAVEQTAWGLEWAAKKIKSWRSTRGQRAENK